MKFLVTKDLSHSRLLAYLIGAVMFAIILYLAMDVVLHSYVIGLDIPTIHTTLTGNAETFEEPILIDSLLLQVHIDLFMTLFALLILSSVYIRLYEKTSVMKVILHTLFLLGLFTPLFLLLAYFWSDIFAYVWLGSFMVWHTMAVLLVLMTFKRLNFR
jgi:hypothetical protein